MHAKSCACVIIERVLAFRIDFCLLLNQITDKVENPAEA